MTGQTPAKMLDKELRRLGGRRRRTSRGVEYTFPDGAVRLIRPGITPQSVSTIIRDAQHRYGRPDRALRGEQVRGSAVPTVDMTKLSATEHARERLALMKRQGGVGMGEITTALVCPTRVLWNDVHGTWQWVGDRVAVVAHITDDGVTVIRTILWSTTELWAQHPRPEKAGTT